MAEGNEIIKQVAKDTVVVQQLTLTSVDRTPKDIASWRVALRNAESIYAPNRTQLLDLYDEVKLDGHLCGIVGKRIDAVLNKALHFETRDGQRVDAMEELLESEVFYNIITLILETRFYGVGGLEFIPGSELNFVEIPRKHIKLERGLIALTQNDTTGIPYKDNPNLLILGEPWKLGLFLQCTPYALFKRGDMSDWAQFIEIFGQPMRIGKYDAYDPTVRGQLKRAMDEMGSSFSAMIPKQAEFEILDGKQTNANGDLQAKFREACNEEMSVVILGNTETTSKASGSGYAIAKEHGKQQMEITRRDMSYVLQKLNSPQFKAILQSYGYPVASGHFAWEKERDLNELVLRAQVDVQVSQQVPLDDDYWYRTYGIDKPANYEQLKAEKEAQKQAMQSAITGNSNQQQANEAARQQQQAAAAGEAAKNLSAADVSWLQRLRYKLADFFDPAP